ncbi:HAD family hydrolase [Francisella sp. 19X1-34]|uniref:HAD family hydrolase n=1 Tax=Francisella sp. 19X1-34 TaxID=3087177 RepID=UPI002E34776E|nr:HAD family hydrolase [Francisella sp. 19X1-34]MED7787872.1 HAD family hydrolase [Francisella sp. 19X1-34]
MIKAIIFDLDQTLIDRDATMINFLSEQHNRILNNVVNKDSFVNSVIKFQESGYADKFIAYQKTCINMKIDCSLALDLYKDMENSYGENPILLEGAKEVLEYLSKDYKIGLISNGPRRWQENKIKYSNIGSFFDSIIISGKKGIKKPNIEIFHKSCNDLNVRPKESVYIGDHPTNDIEAAIDAGMYGVWVKNENYCKPYKYNYIIDSLKDLIDKPWLNHIYQL